MLCYIVRKSLFPLGNLLISPEIIGLGVDTQSLLRRHQCGDFGCVDPYDIDRNHHAIKSGEGILSQYHVTISGKKILICVMTEADRSFTVIFVVDKNNPESPEASQNGNNGEPA